MGKQSKLDLFSEPKLRSHDQTDGNNREEKYKQEMLLMEHVL